VSRNETEEHCFDRHYLSVQAIPVPVTVVLST